ncbi:RING/U-box superfamily protein [Euphorbia peplus]|nr:RING/U-box superfamily protein [Euphorbia peplus]
MGSEDDDNDHINFDWTITNASIVYFLFGVLLMFFLRLYLLRRRLRLINRQIAPDHVTDLNSGNDPPKTGLESTVINSLPEFKFKGNHEDGEITECSVCLGAIVEDAMVRVLPNCKHMYHNDCIDAWLRSNVTCPICRAMAEPMAENNVDGHHVPPLEETVSQSGGASGFRFGSFRWMVGRDRSSSVRSCGGEIIGNHDLERC